MTDDSTQDEPIMSGSDEATDDEKVAGRDEQDKADAEFLAGKDATTDKQPDADPAVSSYANPSSSDLSHGERDGDG
jgi:hypothetical protein